MRVFVYCRVAHDDSFSLEAQATQLRRYAEQAGYTIIGATAEQGSGLALDRPGLEKVTQAVLTGKVDMVLVNSIDRIGREWGMTQAYIDLLTQHKVKLLCIRDRLLFDKQGVTYFEQIKKMRSARYRILRSYKDTPHGPSDWSRTSLTLVPNQVPNR